MREGAGSVGTVLFRYKTQRWLNILVIQKYSRTGKFEGRGHEGASAPELWFGGVSVFLTISLSSFPYRRASVGVPLELLSHHLRLLDRGQQ